MIIEVVRDECYPFIVIFKCGTCQQKFVVKYFDDPADVDLKCRHCGSETTYLTNYYPTYGDWKIARLKQIERRKEK